MLGNRRNTEQIAIQLTTVCQILGAPRGQHQHLHVHTQTGIGFL
ncbi:hypothetical protein SAMN05216217_104158 [Halopseudomonas yangmingensis]|uniref:Uncharacterized protein n=1 Tax=Halopseudomonas yangmingensis TaxID=1720063 RepID=A0A1I4QGT4_9GAMM|nr:hypothetical protein SAMN05216217_104158 [Halopseudomonas yangmingensis]